MPSLSPDDAMREALALAECAIGLSEPNPRVGCVITSVDGRVIGRGSCSIGGANDGHLQ